MPSDPNLNPDPKLSPAAKQVQQDSRQFAIAFELPFVIVAAIAVGGGMGWALDHYLHTKPVLMLIFGAVGFAVGIRDVLRRVSDQ
jgi:ATP synthase protein I